MNKSKSASIYINAKFLCENPTGIGRFSIELSKQLIKLLPNLKFVAPHKVLLKEIANELKVEFYGNFTGALWEQLELPLFLRKKGNPLLINFTSTAPVFYKNQINTIHDITSLSHPEWYSKTTSLYYKLLLPHVAHNCNKLITVSNYVKEELKNYFKIEQSKIEVVYNDVSDIFKIHTDRKSDESTQKYILSVGSIDPRKNLQRTINAFVKLNLSDYKLILIGHKHKAFSKSNISIPVGFEDKIVFTGYVTDSELVDYYTNASLFVYLSLEEGFGIPPLEAMACGCASVVSSSSSLPEICADCVIYSDAYNVDEICNSIRKGLFDNEMNQKLKSKYAGNLSRFSWNQSAQKIVNIIKSYHTDKT